MKKSLSDHNHFLHIIYIVLMQIGLHSAIEHLRSRVYGQLGGFAVGLKKALIKLLFWCGEAWLNVHSNVKRSYLTSGRSIRRPEIELFLACPNFSDNSLPYGDGVCLSKLYLHCSFVKITLCKWTN